MRQWLAANGGELPAALQQQVDQVASRGGTPLVVAEPQRALG